MTLKKTLENNVFSPFPKVYSALSNREIIILATCNLLSANAFNFVTSKILLFGKDLIVPKQRLV